MAIDVEDMSDVVVFVQLFKDASSARIKSNEAAGKEWSRVEWRGVLC